MATLTILEEALRGGEQARLLEQKCRNELKEAEEAVEKTIEATPKFLTLTRDQHEKHIEEAESLETQLDMLGESLDDLMKNSKQMIAQTKKENEKRKALESLSKIIQPYVHVANSLNQSDNLANLSFEQLENIYKLLQSSIKIAQNNPNILQLQKTIPELEERIDQIKITMKSLFLNLYEIKPNSIAIKQLSKYQTDNINSISKSLSNIDLLKSIIEDMISQLLSNNVAVSISCATNCTEQQLNNQYVINWSTSQSDSELLEFDFDDIDTATDADIDAMTDNLDIGNAAARALKIFDVLRLKLVGESFSRELAFALQSWFCNHVLPSTIVLSSRRNSHANSMSTSGNDKLHSRVAAVSAAARAIQAAIRFRGVPSFVLIVEMDALEAKVGSECRTQAILRTCNAITSFSAAAHDNDEVLACPTSAKTYQPESVRSEDYFDPCLVTKTGVAIHEIFVSTRNDAKEAYKGGSIGISNVMTSAALECLRKYREDIPVQYMDELRSSLRLKALYYTDCTMFMHTLKLEKIESPKDEKIFEEELNELSNAANRAMGSIRKSAQRRLDENMNSACRNGSLGAYGTLTRIQRNSSLSAAFHTMKEVITICSQFVPTELAEIAAGNLLVRYLNKLCDEVIKLPEISADACEQIDKILKEADTNVNTLLDLVRGIEDVRSAMGGQPPPVIKLMRKLLQRVHAIREILNSRMEDITTNFRQGKYNELISRQEVEHFIRAIFEDTDLRATFIADLDITVEKESGDWNTDW